jgi:hypothetical protein
MISNVNLPSKSQAAHAEIPHFVAKCPHCAHFLVNRLIEAVRDASDAAGGYIDANGCRYPDPKLEALEDRAELFVRARDAARLYRSINREAGWHHVRAGYDCSEKHPPNTDSLCATALPDSTDTPLLLEERYAAKNFHTRRVRVFLLALGVGT